jgi:hypothetical protein
LTAPAIGGVATFTGITETIAGAFVFKASASGLTSGTSKTFNVMPGPGVAPRFVGIPSSITAGVPFSYQVIIGDTYGNTATSYGATIGVGLAPGSTGVFSGPVTVVASNGVGNFTNSLSPAGSYSLRAVFSGSMIATATVSVH